jgi:DNA-binding MarR family transcriptional regulator
MISHTDLIQTMRQFMDLAMHHTMHERVHFAKALGLSMPQLGVLLQLRYRGNCGVSDISDRFDITNAAASQLVDKLVQSKLIQREEDPQDRRAKLLNLTEKAKELMQRNMEERYRWVGKLAEKLTPEERTKVVEALSIMTNAAQELEAESTEQIT